MQRVSPAPFRVVLDACVLFPFGLRDCLLEAAAAGFYQAYWTDEILAEVTRNLIARGKVSDEQAARLVVAMRRAFPESTVDGYQALVAVMTNDEGDRHVAAAAVSVGAQVIVTSNLRHFPDGSLSPFNLEAQSPDDFLQVLLDVDPAEMLLVIRTMADARRKPPMTMAQVVDGLGQTVPGFAGRLREIMRAP